MTNSIIQSSKLVIIALLFTSFFGALPPQQIMVLGCGMALAFTIKCLFIGPRGRFGIALFLYLLFYICSGISSLYYEKQTLVATFTSMDSINFYPVLCYFILVSLSYNKYSVEKAIKILYILFLICFFIQLVAMPRLVFELATDYTEIGRFTMLGQSIAYVGGLYYYNKYLLTNDRQSLILLLPSLMVLFVAGFRTQLAVILLCILWMTYIVKKAKIVIYSIGFIVVAIILMQFGVVQNSIDNMIARQTEGASFSNSDYIRVIQFNYFTEHHFHSWIEYIFGSGLPNPDTKYGRPFYEVDEFIGPYNGFRDWGIIGLSWMIGLPTIICILYPVYKILRSRINYETLYIKFYYVFVLISGMTTVEFYRSGSFFIHGFLFYIFELSNIKLNNEKAHRKQIR